MKKQHILVAVFWFVAQNLLAQLPLDTLLKQYDVAFQSKNWDQSLHLALLIKDSSSVVYGHKSVKTSLAEMRIANCMLQKGKYLASDSILKAARRNMEEIGQAASMEQADILSQHGLTFFFLSDHSSALQVWEKSFEIKSKQLPYNDIALVKLKRNMAMMHLNMGNADKAEVLFFDALHMLENDNKKDNALYLYILGDLGSLRTQQGRYTEAIDFQEQSRVLLKEKFGDNSFEYLVGILKLMYSYAQSYRFDEAEPLALKAVALADQYRSPIQQAEAYGKLGTIQSSMGLLDDAQENMQKGIDIMNQPDLRSQMVSTYLYFNQADIFIGKGDYQRALEAIIHSEESIPATGTKELIYWRVNIKKAQVLLLLSRLTEVRPILDSVDHEYVMQMFDRYSQARFYLLRAQYAQQTGEVEKALAFCNKAMTLSEYLPHLTDKGTLRQISIVTRQNNPTSALEQIAQYSAAERSALLSTFSFTSEKEKMAAVNETQMNFALFSNFYWENNLNATNFLEQLVNQQLFTKNLSESATKNVFALVKNSTDQALKQQYREWLIAREQLNALYEDDHAENKGDIKAMEAKTNLLEKEIVKKAYPNMPKLVEDWHEIQGLLLPGEAAVDIRRYQAYGKYDFRDTAYYHAAIIRPEWSAPVLVNFDKGNELESVWTARLFSDLRDKQPLSNDFYQNSWQLLEQHLTGIHTIYYSPDGIFHKINPATLIASNGQFLLEKWDIVTLTDLSQLLSHKTSTTINRKAGTAVLIGNPNFQVESTSNQPVNSSRPSLYRSILDEAEPDFELKPLPGSEREVLAIEQRLKAANWETQVFTRQAATETAVKMVQNPVILHLATHGHFMKDGRRNNPVIHFGNNSSRNASLRSMLFFTGADNTLKGQGFADDDGILTAFEAAVLRLEGTEMVVLSACNTGLGTIKNGEGVIGLQRAFRLAGAKSLVMSLWEVEDNATELFMNVFYEGLFKGQTKADAFRAAQRSLKARYPQPFYWGAFVLVNG